MHRDAAGGIHVLRRARTGEWLLNGMGRRLNVLRVWRWSTRPGWSCRELHADRWAMSVHDVRRAPRAKRRRWYALPEPVELVPQHVDLPAHILVSLLQIADEVNRFEETRRFSTRTRKRRSVGAPLLRISHLLAFIPLSAGSWSRSSSKRSFISFRLFRSASLCDTLSSGERE